MELYRYERYGLLVSHLQLEAVVAGAGPYRSIEHNIQGSVLHHSEDQVPGRASRNQVARAEEGLPTEVTEGWVARTQPTPL